MMDRPPLTLRRMARGLLLRSALLVIAFLFLDALGLRSTAGFLSGTFEPIHGSAGLAIFLGILYVLAYLGCILLAPILFLAALFLWLAEGIAPWLRRRRPGLSGSGAVAGESPR